MGLLPGQTGPFEVGMVSYPQGVVTSITDSFPSVD